MDAPRRLSLLNADKLILLLFVAFLLSEEAQSLLYNSGLRWAYLLLLAFGLVYTGVPLAY